MNGTVAITGASGFLGQAILRRLQSTNPMVRGYTRGDVAGLQRVDNYAEIGNADVIIHCAQSSDARRVAAEGPELLLEALSLTRTLAGKSARLVFASSAVVYGDSIDRARRTDENVHTANAYSQMKIESEEVVARAGGVSARLVNLCGHNQPEGTVLSDILHQIGREGPLVVRNARAVRDFLWVSDAADAISLMVSASHLPNTLNVGSGVPRAIGDFASEILAARGENRRQIVSSGPLLESSLWVDISETTCCLGWVPQQSIIDNIAALQGKE